MNSIEEVRVKLAKKSGNFKTAFSTPAGEQVLQALREEFGSDQLCKPNATHRDDTVAAAQYDVLNYINLMLNYEGE